MAHIIYRPTANQGFGHFIINGVDLSLEVYRGMELVEVGDDPMTSEVGLRVTFAISRLDLGGEEDVQVTDRFGEVAQRVRSMTDEAESA